MLIVYIAYKLITLSENDNFIGIEALSSSNFKQWKEHFLFKIELTDAYIALIKEKPAYLTTSSTNPKKAHFAT